MTTEFGLKELYEVVIRATYPIEVSGRVIQTGEAIAAFDKIQIANIQEVKNSVAARGGWDNRGLVYWDSTREVRINFTQGIFNKYQLALMTNAKLIKESQGSGLLLSKREVLESNEDGNIILTYTAAEPIFVYNNSDGTKVTFTKVDGNTLHIETPFLEVLVDYSYEYDNSYKVLTVGQLLTQGFLSLEGKTRVKDDETGQTHTGILYIPKLKLMSDLSMRLGQNATPQVGRLDATAVPTGDRRNTEVMHLIFLEDDIDSDM